MNTDNAYPGPAPDDENEPEKKLTPIPDMMDDLRAMAYITSVYQLNYGPLQPRGPMQN